MKLTHQVIATADKPNKNERVYPRKLLERLVNEFRPDRTLLGHLDMPDDNKIHYDRLSHIVTSLELDDDELVADVEVLDTPCGKILQSLFDDQLNIVFRLAGLSTSGEPNEDGHLVIDDASYDLISINALSANEAS